MNEPLVIVGAGGHARETALAFLLTTPRDRFLGFLDDRLTGTTPEGWPVLGGLDVAPSHTKARFIVAVNDPRTRRSIVTRLIEAGIDRWASVVHPEIRLHESIRLGVGSAVLGGCQLTTNIQIGNHCILNRGAQVSHDCVIGDFCSFNPTACVAGNVSVGEGCELGSACAIRQGVAIGAGATIGMGAVVINGVDANSVVVGNPARVLRSHQDQ
jgi:sugar O-acyltransferase (sialic acid O-acetyltransferase NeuD family)